MKRGEPLVRRTPLRTVARIRQQSTKRAAKATEYRTTKAALEAREGGSCAGSCGSLGTDPHHRKNRSQGGRDDLWTLVLLCRPCHDAIGRMPKWAYARGWLVPRDQDPAHWPVLRKFRGTVQWVQPTPDPGPDGWVPASPHPEQVRLLDLNGESA